MIRAAWRKCVWAIQARPLISAMAVFCLSALALLALKLVAGLPSLGEIGYPDSSVMYSVAHYQRTGQVYRDLSYAPYTPSMYGPLGYRLLAVPGALYTFTNPFLGPRLALFLCFIGCIAVTASIAHNIVGSRAATAWGALFAASFVTMQDWVLQLRADLPAVLSGLIAVRLVLSGGPGMILLAGAFAGAAPLFKQSYISVLAGCALWLLVERRWTDAALFAGAGVVTAGLGFSGYSLLEPRMLENFAALGPILAHPRGTIRLAGIVAQEPVFLLALATVVVGWRSAWDRAGLVGLTAAVSGVVALATSVQVGANVNYYFEMLFLSAPIAVLGLLGYTTSERRPTISVVMLSGVVLLYFAAPNVLESRDQLSALSTSETNASWIAFQGAVEDRQLLSFVPRVAAMYESPPVLDPFLHETWERTGKPDDLHLAERVRRQDYEGVVTRESPDVFRGVQFPNPDQVNAIADAYTPYCGMLGLVVHLPTGSGRSADLADDLSQAGCRPIETD